MLDTKGPEIRTHNMENDAIELIEGNTVTISMEEVLGTEEKFSVTYEGLIDDVQVGAKFYWMMDSLALKLLMFIKIKKK